MKKFYAVRKGTQTGIFTGWDTCKSAITGFSGAEYKGFNTIEEAETYMGITNVSGVQIATYGVLEGTTLKVGGIVYPNHSFYQEVDISGYTSLGHIANEIVSVLVGLLVAKHLNIQDITIIYNYDGIKSWGTGEWAATKELPSLYKSIVNRYKINYIKNKDLINKASAIAKNKNNSTEKIQFSTLISQL